jgi:uncharacterized protein (TIGR03382 family)
VIQAGVEQCDDGNASAGDGCDPACAIEHANGPGPAASGGGCQASGGGSSGMLVAGLVLAAVRRRRRSGPA